MKRQKDRLHRVIVIGATPAGVAATNKLGELGIPVTLVDSEADLDKKLSKEEWRLNSGVTMNYAHRPGLLRIFRNPAINTMMPAEITSIRHTPQGFRAKINVTETFIDPEKCTLCGRCKEICPGLTIEGNTPIDLNGRGSLPSRVIIDKRRKPFCQENCPLGVNAQAYIALSRAGRFAEALDVVRQNNILPGICGRICTHPCEKSCRRGDLDDPIAIRSIKRFLADYELSEKLKFDIPDTPNRPEKIAIVGSGPSGLSAAANLARHGYQVTVFEKEDKIGGLLRYAIGPHRLPRDILDYEIAYIEKLGVKFNASHPIDLNADIKKLKKDFNAVVLAIGAWKDRQVGAPGEDLKGVHSCIDFLSQLYRKEDDKLLTTDSYKNEKIAVIGDGPAAFDLARALRRMGAEVSILSWFPKEIIPAGEPEIKEAIEEGISIIDSMQVITFSGNNGKFEGVTCKPTKPGKPDSQGITWPAIVKDSKATDMDFDRIVVAIGQTGPFINGKTPKGILSTDAGFIETNDSMQTGLPGVYAVGDTASGPSSVVQAMANGKNLADIIHMELSPEEILDTKGTRPENSDFPEIPGDIPSLIRPTMPERHPASRIKSFSEVALGLSQSQVISEAERCLQCGICSECLLCLEACGQIGAINHKEISKEIIEQGGVVIIADPDAAPPIKGEDVIRAYGPKSAKSSVNAMITRGFAAAANAMILLSGSSFRIKGHGITFAPPDPELSEEIRIGVFVCKCNHALGWSDKIDEYVENLSATDDIVHTEVMNSACVPEGSADILRAIRENGITRLVLASCICCPLDFVCSACTNQRSRLKDALFKGTGVSRSMVETCNLRGEVLPLLNHDEAKALQHLTGLVDRSIMRARRLKSLSSPARTYNFATAVIGDSESSVQSAITLAEAGHEVFMFRTNENPFSVKLNHPNINCFEDAFPKGISGTLGDFQILTESDNGNGARFFQVGSIIMGEKARRIVPYILQEGLPGKMIVPTIQKKGLENIPYRYPGASSVSGLFLTDPPGLRVSEKKKGAAAAILAASVMPRGPRQNKGYTVVVDKYLCRGCGRCINTCPYLAITFQENAVGGWHAVVDEALCKGCGNCISVCPSNAADSPYRDQVYLERLIKEVIT
ncbi:FAD-dependent oxidoreductase [Thermodesulfobacteriota bacterium]